MSLTSILKHKEFQEVRDKFKTEFLRPPFDIISEIKAPPLTTNNGVIGVAFDYLLRFYLEYHNREAFRQRDRWVADHSYEMLQKKLITSKDTKIATGYYKDKVFKRKELLKLINDQYEQTKSNYKKFVVNGHLTDEFIANTIFLAKLDVYFRAEIIDKNFDFHDPEDIRDIKAIISLVNAEHFIAKEKCYFNPHFGIGSILVGGADADLIIDNTLIDIKSTKNLELERRDLNQILGYYILSLIGGVNNKPQDKPIEKIGIYFARYGELWTIPVLQLGNEQKFNDFKNWFIHFVIENTEIPNNVKKLLQILSTKQNKVKLRTKKTVISQKSSVSKRKNIPVKKKPTKKR